MTQQVNLTQELARLSCFTAKVATAIRMYSAYNQSDVDNTKQFAQEDTLWLSDCLHSFAMLGNAVLSGDAKQIDFACDVLSDEYREYLSVDRPGYRPSCASFERNAKRFSLQEGIDIFESIKGKVSVSIQNHLV